MTVKNHTKVNTCMSCLGITEGHLEHNALLLQQSRYEKGSNVFHENSQSLSHIAAEADA